jgi:hypothetical protein
MRFADAKQPGAAGTCGDDEVASWAQKLERQAERHIDRRVLTALVASTTITLLLIGPYVVRAL